MLKVKVLRAGEKISVFFLCGLIFSVVIVAVISDQKARIYPKKKTSPPYYIHIDGAVAYPGQYLWKRQETVMDVVQRAIPKKEANLSFVPPRQKVKNSFSVFVPYKENF